MYIIHAIQCQKAYHAVCIASYTRSPCLFQVRCRRAFLNAVHGLYMDPHSRSYYVMNQLDTSLDNVDQRLTADVDLALQFMVTAAARGRGVASVKGGRSIEGRTFT